MMTRTNNDFTLLAITLYREARGEGKQGMLAVGCVVRNLAAKENKSIYEICVQKNEFSSITVHSDPETTLWPAIADTSWQLAQELATQVLNTGTEDITNGALYYANIASVTSGWFVNEIMRKPAEHPVVVKIGNHTFYK